jgi:hypothetical protein
MMKQYLPIVKNASADQHQQSIAEKCIRSHDRVSKRRSARGLFRLYFNTSQTIMNKNKPSHQPII